MNMKRRVSVLIVCILVITLVGCSGNSNEHEGEAKTPSDSSAQIGRDYQEVINDFEEEGFKNIKTETLEDLVTSSRTKDGEVESVSVDGSEDYSSDVWYSNEVDVVITYHTFSKDAVADDEGTEDTAGDTIITVENNEDMAALFKVSDFDPFISEFAKKYAGKTIGFDGYIADMVPHENYTTRFDLLIYTGNSGESSGNALSFKFEDINITSDLKLTGDNIPDNIDVGQNLYIIAKVVKYDENQGLFFLKPLSTEIR